MDQVEEKGDLHSFEIPSLPSQEANKLNALKVTIWVKVFDYSYEKKKLKEDENMLAVSLSRILSYHG